MEFSFLRIAIYTFAGLAAFVLIGLFQATLSAVFLGPIAAAIDVKVLGRKRRLLIICGSILFGIAVFPWSNVM